mgnify:CR=1 FL=1
MSSSAKLKVTQIKSHRNVVVDNTPAFRGMIKKVLHLVTVEEVAG